ncbi:MAG: pantoate--beta-alanine ligase [Phycisphaerae bacterium]|nr:pantoate--beta-alanine ligase [Phycisphaerae bacterium]MCZ2398764.1 pantoate--beta-alanine ligase [Phycisphaerae bacterium]NUQ49034.1 pantoate--beta-alanine ligase [Phycisphaerae bacterium]
MEILRTIVEVRAAVAKARRLGRRVGLVPTMGALHEGHGSLIDAARRDCDFVIVSIFVNPTQFGPNEDFARYPRDEPGDTRLCSARGVDVVFAPAPGEMYPPGAVTAVAVPGLSEVLCGRFRPGHFTGVATIVAKLFNAVQPDVAYFGQKDAQQLTIIRRMTADLEFPVEIVGCPTVREADGLALSSRNRYLSADERGRALCLYRALEAARAMILAGQTDVQAVVAQMRMIVEAARPARIDYIELVSPETLLPAADCRGPVLAALAVHIGQTRLIDNLLVDPRAADR